MPWEGWKCYFRDPIFQNLTEEHATALLMGAAPPPNKSHLATALQLHEHVHVLIRCGN